MTRQENEVARLEQAVRDSLSDPDEVTRLSQLLKIAIQECGRLRAEFQKQFGAPTARANGAARGAMLLNNPIDQSTARMLPTDPSGQNVNGLNGMVGPFMNPSMPTFQPIFGDPSGIAINADQAGFQRLPGSGPMSAQQYEATLDLNYAADRQWEWKEMQWKIDHLEAERICGQQVENKQASESKWICGKLTVLKPNGFVDRQRRFLLSSLTWCQRATVSSMLPLWTLLH